MIDISDYINEKLSLNANSSFNNTNEIMPTDSNAQDYCDKINSSKFLNQHWVVKLYEDDNNKMFFCLRTKNNEDPKNPFKGEPYITSIWLEDLAKYFGHLYIIVSKYAEIDRSSRINNLRRTYYDFYLGNHGQILNDKKEANKVLKYNKMNGIIQQYDRTYKVMTIKEASELKGSIYGDHLGDIRFRLEIV